MSLSVKRFIVFSSIASLTSFGSVYTGSLLYEQEGPPGGAVLSESFNAIADALPNSWLNRSELSWIVSNEEIGSPAGYDWFYSYTLDVHKFAPVTWMIETGAGFSEANIQGVNVTGDFATDPGVWSYEIGWYQTEGDQTGDFLRSMPEQRYGILFQNTSEGGGESEGAITVSFWSNQAPVWGDLYANCGGNGNRGWNAGFEQDNPTDPADSGTIMNHVLVAIPEPSTLSLLVVAGLFLMKRRQESSKS